MSDLDATRFAPGDRVKVGTQLGTLRWLGHVHYAQGTFAGVELDNEKGKNDGSVKGTRYFTCKAKHGVFSKVAAVELVQAASLPVDERHEEQASEHRLKGNELFKDGKIKEAIAEYSTALKLTPRNPIVLGNRSAAWLQLGNPHEALRDIEVAIVVDPSLWKMHMRKGKALMALSEYDQAATAFEAAHSIVKDDQSMERESMKLKLMRDEALDRSDETVEMLSDEDDFPGMTGGADPGSEDELAELFKQFQQPEFLKMMQHDPEFQRMVQADPKMEMMFENMLAKSESFPNGTAMGEPSMSLATAPMEQTDANWTVPIAPQEEQQTKARFQKPVLRVFDLHEAVQNENLAEVQKVLSNDKACIDEVDDHGLTALAWACKKGNIGIVQVLLDSGAQVNPRKVVHGKDSKEQDTKPTGGGGADDDDDEDDVVALHEACRKGHVKIAELLVNHGADVLARESILGHTAMHRAVESGNHEMCRFLTKQERTLLDLPSFSGITPAGLAVSRQDIEMLKVLVNLGATTNEPSSLTSSLSQLVKAGTKKCEPLILQQMLELLWSSGAKADVYEIYTAAREESAMLFVFLEGYKNKEAGQAQTVWHICASRRRNSSAVQPLMNCGFGNIINEKNCEGLTCLHIALKHSDPDMVESLITEAGADVTIADDNGNTPLHIAGAEMGQVWELLLRHGADPNALNNDGKEPVLKENPADKCVIF